MRIFGGVLASILCVVSGVLRLSGFRCLLTAEPRSRRGYAENYRLRRSFEGVLKLRLLRRRRWLTISTKKNN